MPYSVYPLGPLETNSYLVYKDGQAVVIDAGGDPAPILHDLRAKGLTLAAICLTHRHFDHMYGVATLVKETGAPVYSPRCLPDRYGILRRRHLGLPAGACLREP